MHSNVVYQRGADTAWRTIVGETIVVHLHAKEFFGLNGTAAEIWHALDGTADLALLSARSGIDPEWVDSFCTELLALGLVEVVEENHAPAKGAAEPEIMLPGGPRTEDVDPPRIVWREEIRQVAQSCAFSPGMNPLCTQVPYS